MSESALFQSYRETQRRKAERALDDALERAAIAPPAAPASEPTSEPAAEPAAPASPDAPGVLASIGRGAAKTFKRAVEGGKGIADAILPPDPRAAPGAGGRALQGFIGLIDLVYPFGAFANETGGDAVAWLTNVAGDVTDKRLQQRLAHARYAAAHLPGADVHGDAFSDVAVLERLLTVPEAERLAAVKDAAGFSIEVLSALVPGYTLVAKGLKALQAPSRGAAAVPPAPTARQPLALTEGTPPTTTGAVIEMPGDVAVSSQDRLVSALAKPEHRMTLTEIAQRAMDERRALEAAATERLGKPGADRVAQTPEREVLRREGRTPIEAEPRAPAFNPEAYAKSKGAVYQGKWEGFDLHEFREDALTQGGNFNVRGELTQESFDAAYKAHVTRFDAAQRGLEKDARAIPDDVWTRQAFGDSESGKVNPNVLLAMTRAALGAAAGASLGENPEQRAFMALVGAGLGSVASRKAAQSIARWVTDPKVKGLLTEEHGALFPKRAPGEMPNTARMGASTEAKQLVRGINARLAAARRLSRTAAQTHEDTIAAAVHSKYRTVESVLELPDHRPLPAADQTAARGVRDFVLEDVLETAARAKETGDPALAEQVWMKYLVASRVSEKVTNVQTAGARTLEAGKITSDPRLAAHPVDWDTLSRDMAEYARGMEGVQVDRNTLIDALMELGDRAKIAKLAENAKKAPSAWWSIYYGLNLLSSPMFHPKNIIGNSSALALSIVSRQVGEIIALPWRYATGKSGGVAPGEAMDLAIGAWESLRDAMVAGRKLYRTGESAFTGSSKYGEQMDLMTAHRLWAQEGGIVPIAIDAMARLGTKNLRFAAGVDEYFKVLGFAGETRALARRQAYESGKRGKALVEEQARLINDPPANIIAAADDFAHYNTFTKSFDPEGFMGRAHGLASTPFARLTVTPFFRTPVRITEYGLEYTPILNVLAQKTTSDLAAGGARAQMAMAKTAVGAAMIYGLSTYAAAGMITADYSRDPALRNRQKEAGWKPFSVYSPLTNKYYSYRGLGPLIAPLAAAATYAQMGPHLDDASVLSQFLAMTIATAKATMEESYFDALGELMHVFEALDRDEQTEAAFKYAADRVQSLVPAASALAWGARMTDGEIKDLKSFGRQFGPEWGDVFNLFSTTMSRLPGLSAKVPAYRNIITGEPIPLEGGLLPGLISTPTDDPVLVEVLELGGAGLPREIPRHVGGPKAPETTFRVQPPADGTVAPLTHAQRTRLADLLTKEVKLDGRTLHQSLTDMIVGPGDQHDEYMEQSDGKRGGKALLISQLWHAYLDEAEGQLLEEDKALQELVRSAMISRARQIIPPAQLEEFEESIR